ncbi:MAG: B-box zinc finger protein, partial [Bryobacteraceae bacterium]
MERSSRRRGNRAACPDWRKGPMNCANHPELGAVAYCRACGKALCETCQRTAHGTIYCEEHIPMQTT